MLGRRSGCNSFDVLLFPRSVIDKEYNNPDYLLQAMSPVPVSEVDSIPKLHMSFQKNLIFHEEYQKNNNIEGLPSLRSRDYF